MLIWSCIERLAAREAAYDAAEASRGLTADRVPQLLHDDANHLKNDTSTEPQPVAIDQARAFARDGVAVIDLVLGTMTIVLLLLVPSAGIASTPLVASLKDLACGADHVLVGRVTGVDMVDKRGRQIRDENAMTGPGLTNLIRLRLAVDEVLDTRAEQIPDPLKVPLDPFMHYSLGDIKLAHREPSAPVLVFLHGQAFQPLIAGRFLWAIEAREEALELRKQCKP